MQIVPIKELKDGAKISELCHSTSEPIHVTKNGYADMVIMSSDVYEALDAAANASRRHSGQIWDIAYAWQTQ